MSAINPQPDPPRTRRQIWLLIAVFFAPLLIAFALYYGAQGWRPAGQTNKGELIDPPRPLPQTALTNARGESLDPEFMLRTWNLVYLGEGACDARCREALTLMRQTRLALGDDMPRVQRVFFASGECCDHAYLEEQHGGLITVPNAPTQAPALIDQFPSATEGRIYIVDPLGNLMMTYAPDAPPKGLLDDMKKLLKLSHIG